MATVTKAARKNRPFLLFAGTGICALGVVALLFNSGTDQESAPTSLATQPISATARAPSALITPQLTPMAGDEPASNPIPETPAPMTLSELASDPDPVTREEAQALLRLVAEESEL
jgi:hypothetical protein